MATVPMPSLLELPSGSSVNMPGWDGLLAVETGNAWVPSGHSAWEMSCEKDFKSKADKDYRKRTIEPRGVTIETTTFIFVTPRRWTNKKTWEQISKQENSWANKRILDADDLVSWLEQAPAVAAWFAKMIGKLPETGYLPLREWWENWSLVTTPEISPELVIAGRRDHVEKITPWIVEEPVSRYIQGSTRYEAIAFLAACALTESAQWGEPLMNRAIVIQSSEAWKSLENHPSPLVLIRDFSDDNISSKIAVSNGHHVLIPLHSIDSIAGSGLTLSRLGRDETLRALSKMGLSETRTRKLIQSTARHLPVLYRSMIDEAGGMNPEWASCEISHSTSTVLTLISQWDSSNECDQEIVAKVSGQPYELVEQEMGDLILIPDSPLTKIGNLWRVISHEEVWHIFASRLTSTDIGRFEQIASFVLSKISPKLELPIEERYMANIKGAVLPHSATAWRNS